MVSHCWGSQRDKVNYTVFIHLLTIVLCNQSFPLSNEGIWTFSPSTVSFTQDINLHPSTKHYLIQYRICFIVHISFSPSTVNPTVHHQSTAKTPHWYHSVIIMPKYIIFSFVSTLVSGCSIFRNAASSFLLNTFPCYPDSFYFISLNNNLDNNLPLN